ncbi:MAG: hypothetical protein V4550_19530 [Gemmatimonadota bacterium]
MPLSDSRVSGNEASSEERTSQYLDRCREALERWQDGLTLQNLAFAERYLKGEMVVYVNFRVGVGESREYCAVFDNSEVRLGVKVNDQSLGLVKTLAINVGEINGETLQAARDQGYRVVLVGIVELPDCPERVVVAQRVETIEELARRIRCALFFSPQRGFQFIGSRSSGEVILPTIGLRPRRILPKVIEGATKVVDGVRDDSAPLGWNVAVNANGKDSAFPSFRIIIADNFIRVGVAEGVNAPCEIVDVFCGPVDLDLSAGCPSSHDRGNMDAVERFGKTPNAACGRGPC